MTSTQRTSSGSVMFDLNDSEGVNHSERVLTALCKSSFLKLWAQSNVYTDEGFKGGKGGTKELCDVLVIFGRDVLIFSDKHIEFQHDRPTEVAWPRWYRRAVSDSVRQLHGAASWLRRFPARAYQDPLCTRALPIAVPQGPDVRFHLIAVTRGSREAALRASGGQGRGSLCINTRIQGEKDHLQAPFCLGIQDPSKPFVHVFDEVTVELLLRELDTAPDFIEYLLERERLLTPSRLILAQGEEDLLGMYMQTMDETESRHLFYPSTPGSDGPDMMYVEDGIYDHLQKNAVYRRKKKADEVSYAWDQLVERFIELGDPGVHKDLPAQDGVTLEEGLRLLAGESRFRRRLLAQAFLGAVNGVRPGDRVGRLVYSGVAGESVFIFLVVPKRDEESLEEYRHHRIAVLHAYCRIAKLNAPLGTVFVGIAFDNPHKSYKGFSEDLFVYSQQEWTAEDLQELERMRDELNILKGDMRISHFQTNEFPLASNPNAQPEQGLRTNAAVSRSKAKAEKRRKKMKQASQRRNRR